MPDAPNVLKLSPQTKARVDAAEEAINAKTLLKSDKGAIKACEHNARVLIDAALQYSGLHYDEFLSRLRIDDRDWTDADDLGVLCWLQSTYNVATFNVGHARNGARFVAYSRRHDSLREFVESLPAWDTIPRIDAAFADAWGAPDTPLLRASSHNFFVALIARAMKPGAQVDTVWCFEGPQGTYKSRSLRELGGAFHAELSAAIGTIDFQRELRGLWIAELSELDSLRGREASTVKRLLSAPSDRFVQKYALHAETYPRRAIAVASTNEANYWEDPTGARRLIPIPCGDIRVDLIAINRLQWLAEARHRYDQGATWWEFPPAIADEQEARQQVDPWEDLLHDSIAHGRKVGLDGMGREPWPDGWLSTSEIMRDWLRLDAHQQGKASGTRLAKVMRRLGYVPKRSTTGDERGWQPDASPPQAPDVSGEVSDTLPL